MTLLYVWIDFVYFMYSVHLSSSSHSARWRFPASMPPFCPSKRANLFTKSLKSWMPSSKKMIRKGSWKQDDASVHAAYYYYYYYTLHTGLIDHYLIFNSVACSVFSSSLHTYVKASCSSHPCRVDCGFWSTRRQRSSQSWAPSLWVMRGAAESPSASQSSGKPGITSNPTQCSSSSSALALLHCWGINSQPAPVTAS